MHPIKANILKYYSKNLYLERGCCKKGDYYITTLRYATETIQIIKHNCIKIIHFVKQKNNKKLAVHISFQDRIMRYMSVKIKNH